MCSPGVQPLELNGVQSMPKINLTTQHSLFFLLNNQLDHPSFNSNYSTWVLNIQYTSACNIQPQSVTFSESMQHET